MDNIVGSLESSSSQSSKSDDEVERSLYIEREVFDLTPDSVGHSSDCAVLIAPIQDVADAAGHHHEHIPDLGSLHEFAALEESEGSDEENGYGYHGFVELRHAPLSPEIVADSLANNNEEEFQADYDEDETLADKALARLQDEYEACLAAAEGRLPVTHDGEITPSQEFLKEIRRGGTGEEDEMIDENEDLVSQTVSDARPISPIPEDHLQAIQRTMRSISISTSTVPDWVHNIDEDLVARAMKNTFSS